MSIGSCVPAPCVGAADAVRRQAVVAQGHQVLDGQAVVSKRLQFLDVSRSDAVVPHPDQRRGGNLVAERGHAPGVLDVHAVVAHPNQLVERQRVPELAHLSDVLGA